MENYPALPRSYRLMYNLLHTGLIDMIKTSTTTPLEQHHTAEYQEQTSRQHHILVWRTVGFFNNVYTLDLDLETILSWPWPYLTLEQSFLFRCFPWATMLPKFLDQQQQVTCPCESAETTATTAALNTEVQNDDSIINNDDNNNAVDENNKGVDLDDYWSIEYLTHRLVLKDGAVPMPIFVSNQYCMRCIYRKLGELDMENRIRIETHHYAMLICYDEMIRLHRDTEAWCCECIYTPLFKILENKRTCDC